MTPSDRRRILEALERWETRWEETFNDPAGSPSACLGASVDWLRAMSKLAAEYLDPDDSGWTDDNLVQAAMAVRAICRGFAAEIRSEAKNL
jgi:hypothetical protein